LLARKNGRRNVRAGIHGSKPDRMTAFQQFGRVQLVHDGFFQSDLQIELMKLVYSSEAI
jgi:hypothetical protein